MKIFVALVCLAAVASAQYTGPTNQAGLNLIKEFEGWYPNFYTDPVGIRTIGYGHACHVWDCSVPINGKYPVPLSSAHGEQLLQDDLRYPGRYEDCVKNNVRYTGLNANQFSALASFTFNVGCGNFGSSTLLQLLNAGDVAGASEEFPKWVYGGGVVLPGLVRRREAERVLFCTGGACGASSTCKGRVTSDNGINVRSTPNTNGVIVGTLPFGATPTIGSRSTGSTVDGNSNWFHVGNGYASAAYIQITTSNGQPWCSQT